MNDTLPKQPKPPRDESTMAIMLTIADTTWRMITPSLVCVPLGLYADLHWGTKPWLTLVSAAVGITLGFLLIRQQLKDIG